MMDWPFTTRALGSTATGMLVFCCAAGASAAEAPASPPPAGDAPPRKALPPVVSTLDFEAAGYLSLMFAQLAVPESGSLNPVGGGLYAAIRYVPTTFPFHAFFETGGGLFATGTTSGPSGTDYGNALSAWFFSPGVGLDWGAFRLTLGVGPALIMTKHSSAGEGTLTTTLGISSEVGLSYRFFERSTWALSAGLRYQTVPGAKIDALSLGLQLRFGSIAYR